MKTTILVISGSYQEFLKYLKEHRKERTPHSWAPEEDKGGREIRDYVHVSNVEHFRGVDPKTTRYVLYGNYVRNPVRYEVQIRFTPLGENEQ